MRYEQQERSPRSCRTHEGDVNILLNDLINVAHGIRVLDLKSDDKLLVCARLVRATQSAGRVREHRPKAADAFWWVPARGDDLAHNLNAVRHGNHDSVCARVKGTLEDAFRCAYMAN